MNKLPRLLNMSMPEDGNRTRTQVFNSIIHEMYASMVQEDEKTVAEQGVLMPPVIPSTSSQLCKETTLLTEGDEVVQRDEQVLNALKIALARCEELFSAQDRL